MGINEIAQLMYAMSLVLLSWVVLFLSITGLGLFGRRLIGLRINHFEDILMAFWLGWATVLVILQLWHLFFPVDWRVSILILTLGIYGLFWNRRKIWRFNGKWHSQKCFLVGMFLLAASWLANLAIGPPLDYDNGTYELGAVRWASSYPIVPGLGNLLGAFAFNCSYYLYVAMLEIGPFVQRSHHLGNGLLFLVLLCQIFYSAYRLLLQPSKLQSSHLFAIIFFPSVFTMVSWGSPISSISADHVVYLLGIVVTTQLLTFLMDEKSQLQETYFKAFSIIALSAVGITVKLSFFVFGGCSIAIAMGALFYRIRRQGQRPRKKIAVCVATCLIIVLLPWAIRSVILSGYMAYPSTLFPFQVEWRIPRESAVDDANWIRSWGRSPKVHWKYVLGNWSWFKPWACSYRILGNINIGIPLFLIGVACLLISLRGILKHRRPKLGGPFFFVCIPSIAHVVFWFVTAPGPGFAGASFWVLASATTVAAIGEENARGRTSVLSTIRFVTFTLPIFCNVVSGEYNLLKTAVQEHSLVKGLQQIDINRTLLLGPGDDNGFHHTPKTVLKTFVTESGLVLNIPKIGNQCWDAPLPCTPHPKSELRLRVPGDLGSGFIREVQG